MDYLAAMEDTMRLAEEIWPRRMGTNLQVPSLQIEHLRHMAMQMRRRVFSPNKANRWLGWMQAAIVSWGVVELESMKQINLHHRQGSCRPKHEPDKIARMLRAMVRGELGAHKEILQEAAEALELLS